MSNNEYEVGYKRPPRLHQFKKGHRSKPRRHKARKSGKAIVNEVLKKRIRVVENGVSKRVSLFQIIVSRLATRAAGGCKQAMNVLMDLHASQNVRKTIPTIEVMSPRDEEAKDSEGGGDSDKGAPR